MKFLKNIFCIILCISIFLPMIATAEVVELKDISNLYTGPDIEESERVDDSYFKDAVFLGDSLTVSIKTRNLFKGAKYIAGIGTSIIVAAHSKVFEYKKQQKSLEEMLQLYNPKKLYVMMGTNTLNLIKSGDALNDYSELIQVIKANTKDTIVYLISVPTMRNHAVKNYPGLSNKRFIEFNKGLKELAKENEMYYLDICSELIRSKKDLQPRQEYVTGDGIHMSTEGANVFANYIYTHTKQATIELKD